jgi:hypothetical protein
MRDLNASLNTSIPTVRLLLLHPILALQLRPQLNLLLDKHQEKPDPTNRRPNNPYHPQCIRINTLNLLSNPPPNLSINVLLACSYPCPFASNALTAGSEIR